MTSKPRPAVLGGSQGDRPGNRRRPVIESIALSPVTGVFPPHPHHTETEMALTTTYLQFEFPYDGPWGEAMAVHLDSLAHRIAAEDGLTWKIWTENPGARRAGGIYQFHDAAAAERYRRKYVALLSGAGIKDISTRSFEANTVLSRITRAPL